VEDVDFACEFVGSTFSIFISLKNTITKIIDIIEIICRPTAMDVKERSTPWGTVPHSVAGCKSVGVVDIILIL